ncbi:MAG TPA: ABC transporter permease [Marmoricola sp.]|jgi:osmoprotectant transport system permease protein|nr:ABC transporter permease [Marmoricola sp.]
MSGVWTWLSDSSHWKGSDGIPVLLGQHSLLTLVAVTAAAVVGLPVALYLGHHHRGGTLAVNLSNIGRAIPIVALLSLLSLGAIGSADFGPFGRAGLATLITLGLFALPAIITNAYTGVAEVDPDTVEAARGMGMSGWQVLLRVELPLAASLIITGLRLAVVQVWATATIAALVAGPGLGQIITEGYNTNSQAEVVSGALIVGGIALLLEIAMALLQRVADPVARAVR